jgi:hypothetical protein
MTDNDIAKEVFLFFKSKGDSDGLAFELDAFWSKKSNRYDPWDMHSIANVRRSVADGRYHEAFCGALEEASGLCFWDLVHDTVLNDCSDVIGISLEDCPANLCEEVDVSGYYQGIIMFKNRVIKARLELGVSNS